MISADDANLERFGRHVPRILGNQIIAQLVDQYMSDLDSPSIEPEYENTCPPSIERFHAALLFVDISGFTVLSQRLPVDALRLHINAYFKKILDIIFKYGGDVIKFAGDALFIIWQTPVCDLSDPNFEAAAKVSVQRAVSCGQQINMECSNYLIDLAPKKQTASQLTSALLEGKQMPSRPSVSTATSKASNMNLAVDGISPTTGNGASSPTFPASPPPELADMVNRAPSPTPPGAAATGAGAESSTITYLNVHSGVGVGIMAGIDVGANNRWEYLLLGQPLSDVAVAESLANKGELVISPEAHALLCGVPADKGPGSREGSAAASSSCVVSPRQVGSQLPPPLLRAPSRRTSIPSTIRENSPLTVPAPAVPQCGCVRCAENEGFWRVDPSIPLVPAVNTESPEDLAEYDLYFFSEVMERSSVAYREVLQQVDDLVFAKTKGANGIACGSHSISLTSLPTFSLASPRDKAAVVGGGSGGVPMGGAMRSPITSTRSSQSTAILSDRMGHPQSQSQSHRGSADMTASGASLDYSVSPRGVPVGSSLSLSSDAVPGRGSLDLSEFTQVKQIETINEEDTLVLPTGHALEILSPVAESGAAATTIHTKCSAEVTEMLFGHYLSWVQQCLLDDFAMHVHEADRTDFEFHGGARWGALDKFIRTQFPAEGNSRFSTGTVSQVSGPGTTPSSVYSGSQGLSTSVSAATITASSNSNLSLSNLNTPPRRASNFRGSLSGPSVSASSMRESTSFVQKIRTLSTTQLTLKEQNKNKNRRIRNQDTSLTAELRNVIVLFISLKMDSAALLMSDPDTPASEKAIGRSSKKLSEKLSEKASAKCYSRQGDKVISRIKGFHFLTRTEEEFNDDQRIMNSFQDCMEVMTKIFKTNGGQMRQFIVDDKGTVCIGTFGLRGSVTNDNAAAAIDAAGAIIMQLHKIGIAASIGITSGKAYCGLVGAPLRHEYAVMGPSTNLSARLMGKAKQGEVMCDGETRNRDRTHTFAKLGEIQAKGYANPVPTYKPNITKHQKARMGSSNMNIHNINRMETLSGKSTTFFDPAVMLGATSPSFVAPHSLYELSNSSGSQSNLHTPLTSKGTRLGTFRSKYRSKTPHTGEHGHKVPLYGRNDEVNQVFGFLCPNFVAQFGPLTEFAPSTGKFSFSHGAMASPILAGSALSPNGRAALRFDVAPRTKACIVQGPGGVGKSSFLKIFCEKVRNIHRSDPGINMVVFHAQAKGNDAQPFNVWKGVIRQVLLQFAHLADPSGTHSNNRSQAHLQAAESGLSQKEAQQAVVRVDLMKGLEYVLRQLPEEVQELVPLMSSIHFVYGVAENATTSKLAGVTKLLKITELLSALLQQFVAATQKMLIIAIDDLHDMDSASWQLLKHLWEFNTGVVIAATHTANVNTKKGVDLNLFRDLDRLLLLDLKPLSLSATKQIAKTIFDSNGVYHVDDTVYSKLYTMSGGNALFLYELAKAMLEWYHNSVEDLSGGPDGATGENGAAVAQAKGKVSFSDAIQDFRSTRIEEVICYRFDQFDTAAQLLLKLASVACANGEVFSLHLLNYMIQDDSNVMSAFACLHSISTDGDFMQGQGQLGGEVEGERGINLDGEEEGEDTLGFEPEDRGALRTESVLVVTLNSLLNNNEFIKISNKRQETMSGSIRVIQSMRLEGNSGHSLLDDGMDGLDEDEEEDTLGELSPAMGLGPGAGKGGGLHVSPGRYAPAQRSAVALSRMYFDFKIRLEQSTIYELMLNDQKQSLHERVASYLEQQAADRARHQIPLTSTELFEEGFHWERATGWSSAMSCYYRSAMLLDEVGAYQDSFLRLTAAYRMLNAMRNEAGVTEDFQFAPASFQAIFSHAKDPAERDKLHALKKSDIVRIFGGDSALLELGLNVLLRLAQSSFTLSDTPEVTSKLYEDALQLIMLTWNWKEALALNRDLAADLGSSIDDLDGTVALTGSQTSAGVTPSSSPAKLTRSRTHNSDISEFSNFGLQDPSIVFPILAGIAALYRNNKLPDDKQRSKESTLYDLSLVLARTSPDYLPHLICAMCLQRTLLFELGKVKESLTMTDGIVSMYNEKLHAPQLIKAYGHNRVPFTITMHVQLLRVLGHLTKSAVLLNNVLDELPEMTHLHSVGLAVYPIISVMLLEGSQRVALQVFRNYLSLEKERGGYNLFKESNPLFLEALETAVLHEHFMEKRDLSRYVEHSETPAAREMETRILNKEFLPVDKGSRSLLYETLTSFGTSVEHCCGLLLLLKARMTAKRIEMRREQREALVWKYLFAALEYENFHISCCTEEGEPGPAGAPGPQRNVDKLAFAHFGSLVTKACVCAMMVHYEAEVVSTALPTLAGKQAAPDVTINKAELLKEATEALKAVEQIGVTKGCHFITLHAGVYFEVLGLDIRRGKQLQASALDAMQELNGAKDFAAAFDAVISAFPILERFKIKYTLLEDKK